MGSEARTKSSVLSSIRKLLGGDGTEPEEPESGSGADAGNGEESLVLAEGSVGTRGDSAQATSSYANATDAEDGSALVLGSAMRSQETADSATRTAKDDGITDQGPGNSSDESAGPETDSTGAARDGDVNEDTASALLDIGLEDAGPSSVEFNDDDQQDFDPTVWRPVLSAVDQRVGAGDIDEPVTAPEGDQSEEAAKELDTQVDDDKLEGMPVSDKSEDDKVSESASDAEGGNQDEAPNEELTGESDETDAAGSEDFQELLEETVRRIVREELSGDMGLRLSQNISKMIRDQVAEAIPARD